MSRGFTGALACTSGHLRAVDHTLLSLASRAGVLLRYAGDLDPGGRTIAATVARLYRAEIIAMGTEVGGARYQEDDIVLQAIFATDDGPSAMSGATGELDGQETRHSQSG